jgi:4-amino-4-deoxy-L-arabinose transferase-like glycosyltransferase
MISFINIKQLIYGSCQGYRWLLLIMILCIATFLRFYQLKTESLWIDEMLSIDDATGFEWRITNVRPVYYFLLNQWMKLGNSDVWLRSLSILFGLGSIYLTYELGRRLISQQAALIGAFMMAVSPLFINHAQEIRMYTLIPFLSLAGSLGLVMVLMKRSYFGWFLWIIARAILVLTNANNVLILFPDFLIFLIRFRKHPRWLINGGIGFCLIGLSFLPVFYQLVFGGVTDKFMQEQVGSYSYPGVLQIIGMITQFIAYYPLSYLLSSRSFDLSPSELSDASLLSVVLSAQSITILFYGIITLILTFLLVVALIPLLDQRFSKRMLILASWALIPTALMLAVSYLKSSIWFPRYLMFVGPYLLLMVATGFVLVWHWKKSIALAVAVVYFLALSGGLWDYYTNLYRNDWQGASQFLMENEKAGDRLLYYSINRLYEESLPRYYRGKLPIQLIEKNEKNGIAAESQNLLKGIAEELNFSEKIDDRVWLVCWIFCNDKEGIENIFELSLGSDFSVPIHKSFTSIESSLPLEVYMAVPNNQEVDSSN